MAEPPKESVAITTFGPAAELGTLNVQLKAPVEEVTQVEGEVDRASPLKVKVTDVDAGKPLLVAVTMVPIGPAVGIRESAGVVTINKAVATFPYESAADTACEPVVDVGTVKVQFRSPELVELHEVDSFVVSKVMVTVADGAKPLPVRVTWVPTAPLVGLADIEGAVTPKNWLTVFPSASVAVTLCDCAKEGTAKVTWKDPELVDVPVATSVPP